MKSTLFITILFVAALSLNTFAQYSLSAGLSVSPALNFYNEKNSNFNDVNFSFDNFNTGLATGVEIKARLKSLSIESGFNIGLFNSSISFDKSDFSGVDVRIFSKVSGYMYSVPLWVSYPVKNSSGKILANLKIGMTFNYAIKTSSVEIGLRQYLSDTGYVESKFTGKNSYSNNFLSVVLGVGKSITSKKGKETEFSLLYTTGLSEMVSQSLNVDITKNGQQKLYATSAHLKLSSIVLKIAYFPLRKNLSK